MPGIGLGLGLGLTRGGGGAAPSIITDGLVAEWRFDDGSGQVLTDYSGNGHHGQLGSTSGADTNDPAWGASPVRLIFTTNDWVVAGPLPNEIGGIDIVFRPSAQITASTPRQLLFGHGGNTGLIFGSHTGALANELITVGQDTGEGYASNTRVAWGDAGGTISADWHLLQCDHRPGDALTWDIALDGVEKQNIKSGDPVIFQANKTWRIGSNMTPNPFEGDVAYAIVYSQARTDITREQNRTVLTTIMAARGITLP